MTPSSISPPAQKELDRLAELYEVSDSQLKQITEAFGQAFNKGLQVPHQAVTMGPSWVSDTPDGTEKGTTLILELGWNTVRIATVTLDGKRSFTTVSKIVEISKEMMNADSTVFFDFLAGCIREFFQAHNMQNTTGLRLGFGFAFPTEKSSLDHGKLLSWSKGFSIKGVIGQDVVELLQKAFDKAKLGVKCTALINDTVALLLAQSYLETSCIMAVTYGAGTNGCYAEAGAAIRKLPGFQGTSMLINTEWGMMNERGLLKPTIYDDAMDKGCANPGAALFQKMTSWFYLGEIARNIFLSLVDQSLLFNGFATDTLNKHGSLSTFYLYQIEDASDHEKVKSLLCDLFGYAAGSVSDQDAEIARRVTTVIAVRGGKLAACPIASLLTRLGYGSTSADKVSIAVDGELFIGSALFETRLKQGVASIVGNDFDKQLEFHHVQGKGYVGTAIAALQAVNAH
ncbi:hypothetical protein C8J57DRAFT_1240085 [Mycena rebaudengoi]|nr:hypothetical protein C8J57DRAFT_1240085 [Mycena rebaudengoi]